MLLLLRERCVKGVEFSIFTMDNRRTLKRTGRIVCENYIGLCSCKDGRSFDAVNK